MNHLVLGDSLDALLDHRGKTPKKLGGDFVSSGVPVASALLVRDGRLDLSEARYVSRGMHAKWMPVPTRRGDVILTSEAPAGRVARVTSDDALVLGQRLFCLRGKVGVLDSGYLYYALQSHPVQSSILGHSTGTTVVGIRQSALRQVRIPAPPFPEQQAIAEVLGALDDKIAANTALAATIDAYLASLLESLVVGVGATHLESIATVNARSAKPVSGGELRYVDIASVGVGTFDYPELTPWSDAPGRARRGLSRGDTVWSTVRPNRRSHALNLEDDPRLVASTGLAVLSPRDGGYAFLYEATRRPEFTAYLENVAEGSAYPAVRAERFLNAPVPDLSPDRVSEFEVQAAPLREIVASHQRENRTLAATRDALLPQLMSGKLRVRDAETIASNAGA